MAFKRGRGPKYNLNIGSIKTAQDWLTKMGITWSDIEQVRENDKIVNYVDVEGDVWFDGLHISDAGNLPGNIRFRNVTGKFIFENMPPGASFRVNQDQSADMKIKLNIGYARKATDWFEENQIENARLERVDKNDPLYPEKVFYVDVDGDVDLWKYHLDDIDKIPSYLIFRNVTGRFILGNGKL